MSTRQTWIPGRQYGAMITRAPLTDVYCSGTASSHRFNCDANSDSTQIQSIRVPHRWPILRLEYHDPA